eukprot:gene8057-9912_t
MLRQIKRYLNDNPNCKSIVFHIFSNGGGFFYAHFIRLIYSHPEFQFLRQYVKGSVFDSLPTTEFVAGIKAIRGSAGLLMAFLTAIAYPFLIITWFPFLIKYRYYLSYKKNKWLHMIFYSKGDIIVSPEQVKLFADQLRSQVGDLLVHEKCWEESGHVAHLKTYPKEYNQEVDGFVTTVFEKQNDKPKLMSSL